MNTAVHQAPPGGANTRQLWAAVAVLGIAVVALGSSLIHIQTRPVDGHTALAALDPSTATAQESSVADPATSLPVTTVGQGETVLATQAAPAAPPMVEAAPPAAVRKPPSTPVTQAPATPAAAPRVSTPARQPAPAAVVVGTQSNAPMVMSEAGPLVSRPLVPAPRAVCATCGRVESVMAIERKGEAQGVGAVAGGVLGAVLGNQVGKGNGRAIATVLGAVGGGMAGNTIEKNVSKTTVYQVQVRMEDGSLRMVEQSRAPAIGSPVIVEGQQMRPADGPAPVMQARAPAPAVVPQAKVYSSERN